MSLSCLSTNLLVLMSYLNVNTVFVEPHMTPEKIYSRSKIEDLTFKKICIFKNLKISHIKTEKFTKM